MQKCVSVKDGEYLAVPEVDKMTSFQCPATLICVPSHLHLQWQNELKKFTGNKYKALGVAQDAFFGTPWKSQKVRLIFTNWICTEMSTCTTPICEIGFLIDMGQSISQSTNFNY